MTRLVSPIIHPPRQMCTILEDVVRFRSGTDLPDLHGLTLFGNRDLADVRRPNVDGSLWCGERFCPAATVP